MVVRLTQAGCLHTGTAGTGHIHEGFGATTNGETTFINASTCNYRYDRYNLNPPIVFDVPTKRTEPPPGPAPARMSMKCERTENRFKAWLP
jgi:hypothetical protein